MRSLMCVVPAFILLVSTVGCNCCYQPGYYDPYGLACAPSVQSPVFKPIQRPAWLGGNSRKHDPATCPLCSAHAASSPHAAPGSGPMPIPQHGGEFIHENGTTGQSYGNGEYQQYYEDQPIQLDGIVPTSYSERSGSRVEHAGQRHGGCGCGSSGCQNGCKGQCGADRSRERPNCAAAAPRPNCAGVPHNCGCGAPVSHGAPANCGCGGAITGSSPCPTCDVVDGSSMGGFPMNSYPMSGYPMESFPMHGSMNGGCSTCGTAMGSSGMMMGSVVPGTIMDGEIISGGMVPGEMMGDGVIFDGSIVNGGTVHDSTLHGGSHETGKPCASCGKHHSTTVQPPMPEADHHESSPVESLPGQINQGTLKPHSPEDNSYDQKVQPEKSDDDPPLTLEPESLPGAVETPETHPPAGAARARTTPSSWRSSGPQNSQLQNAGGGFEQPVQEPARLEPTTLMIPTIPDQDRTRQVHWVPGSVR